MRSQAVRPRSAPRRPGRVCSSVGSWWKADKRTDRIGLPVSYALLVSLRTPDVSTDLYTPIATRLGVPVEVAPAARTEII
ncbi:hypothetical protein SUDANB51_06991 [Streptomyces sp. enrichment culture]